MKSVAPESAQHSSSSDTTIKVQAWLELSWDLANWPMTDETVVEDEEELDEEV